MNKNTIILSFFIFVLLTSKQLFSSGLETKGIGARARSMGFAMTSVTDHWSAVHYNPASISMSDNKIFGGEYEFFTGGLKSSSSLRNLPLNRANPYKGDFIDYIGDELSCFNEKKIDSDIHFGAMGYITHFDTFSFGIGFYGSGSGTAWEDSMSTYYGDTVDAEVSFINGSMNIPLVFAYKINDNLSIGANLGLRWGLLTVKNEKLRSGMIPYTSKTVQDTEGVAVSYDMGLFWDASPGFNFGLVLKFPFTFRKCGETEVEFSLSNLEVETDTVTKMRYPLRIVGGVSYKFLDKHLIALDINWHDWSKYKLKTDYHNDIPGIFEDSNLNPSSWEDTVVINLGYEYDMNTKWVFRCGITYDEAPEPEDSRILIGGQVIDAWLFSLGAGVNFTSCRLDFGYIHTYGPEVDGFIEGADYSMNLHELFFGIVKKF